MDLNTLKDEIAEILIDDAVEIDLEDESVEIYLKHPSSENYDSILEQIEEFCDDCGFTIDGDYESQLSIY